MNYVTTTKGKGPHNWTTVSHVVHAPEIICPDTETVSTVCGKMLTGYVAMTDNAPIICGRLCKRCFPPVCGGKTK